MTDLVALEDFKTAKYCFYIPGKHYVESGAFLFSDGKYYNPYTMKTLEDMQKDNPNICFMLWDDATKEIEKLDEELLSEVKEISEDRWDEMLNVLPPLDWHDFRGTQTFLLSEAYTGFWYPCFVMANGKYYEGHSNIRKENSKDRIQRFLKK